MMRVEIYEDDGEDGKELLMAEFDCLPRIGEKISILSNDYFNYYDVIKIWHRINLDADEAKVTPCLLVKIDD